jgi:hypoxanthine phosphoribosyltransferase
MSAETTRISSTEFTNPNLELLYSAEQIDARIAELGAEITRDYEGKDLVLVGVLKGSCVFMADLMRAIDQKMTIDFMAVSSYKDGTVSSGDVEILKDLSNPIRGKDVIVVEDIVDTGLTLTYLQDILRARAPRNLRTACLLSKPSRRKVNVRVEYVGFTIEDKFVVGYGLDYGERYRNLPYIGVIGD